jgi:NSS family neurotransmitter:Na+ symporter
MADSQASNAFHWRGQGTFVVIAAGATLSLNDFLTFPVLAGENGGGVFVLMYTFFLLVLGLPLLMSELMLGRLSRGNVVEALHLQSNEHNASLLWKYIGFLALVAGFLILSSFSVVSGWSLAYVFKTALGLYTSISAEDANLRFSEFLADSESMMLWHTLFVLAVVAIAAQELERGLQRALVYIMPTMALLLIVGIIYAFQSQGLNKSIEFILYPDWSKVDVNTPLVALQRAFFTLSLALGVMVIYGAYTSEKVSIGYAAGQIILIDLLFSIFTGLSINALVFGAQLNPVFDDELAFRVLPVVFGGLQYGPLFGGLFYLLLTLAALTTALAILEAMLSCYARKHRMSRLKSALQLGLAIWLLGIGTIFSYSLWNDSGLTLTISLGDDAYRLVNGAGLHDVLTFLSSHLLQPLVALFVAVFVGWIIPRSMSFETLNLPNRKLYELWNFVIRYITPVLVFIVLLTTLGVVGH